jgi:hypothetical protein
MSRRTKEDPEEDEDEDVVNVDNDDGAFIYEIMFR